MSQGIINIGVPFIKGLTVFSIAITSIVKIIAIPTIVIVLIVILTKRLIRRIRIKKLHEDINDLMYEASKDYWEEP